MAKYTKRKLVVLSRAEWLMLDMLSPRSSNSTATLRKALHDYAKASRQFDVDKFFETAMEMAKALPPVQREDHLRDVAALRRFFTGDTTGPAQGLDVVDSSQIFGR